MQKSILGKSLKSNGLNSGCAMDQQNRIEIYVSGYKRFATNLDDVVLMGCSGPQLHTSAFLINNSNDKTQYTHP